HVISGKKLNGNGSVHSEESASIGAVALAEIPHSPETSHNEEPREMISAFTAEDLCGAPAVPVVAVVAPTDEITPDDVCWVPEERRLKPQAPPIEPAPAPKLHVMPSPQKTEGLDLRRPGAPRDPEFSFLTGQAQLEPVITAADISKEPAPYVAGPTFDGVNSAPEITEVTAADISRNSDWGLNDMAPSGPDMPTSFRVIRSAATASPRMEPDARVIEAPAPVIETPAPVTEAPAPISETPAPFVEAFVPPPQAFSSLPEAFTPVPEAFPPVPDVFTPLPDVFTPVPEAFAPVAEPAISVIEPVRTEIEPALEPSSPAPEVSVATDEPVAVEAPSLSDDLSAAPPEIAAAAGAEAYPEHPAEVAGVEAPSAQEQAHTQEAQATEAEKPLAHPEVLPAEQPEPELTTGTAEDKTQVTASENVFARQGFWGNSGEGETSPKAILQGFKDAFPPPGSGEAGKHPEGWFSAWKTMLRLGSVLPWVARALPALESGAINADPGAVGVTAAGSAGVAQETRQDVAGLRLVQYETRTTVQDHSMQLKRMEEQLTRVRES